MGGAFTEIHLDQTEPRHMFLSGWSKADNVDGIQDVHYALYVDVEYTDGSFAYGFNTPFTVGTHEWEHRCGVIAVAKPVKTVRYI